MLTELPLISGFYVSDSLPVSHQRCLNLYESIPDFEALSTKQLVGTPGTVQLVNTGYEQNANRGSVVKDGIYYFVNGSKFYKLNRAFDAFNNESYTYTDLGTISGTGRVSIAHSNSEIMIVVPGVVGYIYDGSTLTNINTTDSDFDANGDALAVVFIDGYFACITDEKKWIISALNDGLDWNAIHFASAESDPDSLVAPVVVNNQIYIIGTETTEGFQNVGGESFPFVRNGLNIDKGCLAPFSVVKTSSTFFMVGAGKNESPAILKFTGNNYEKVSTSAIDTMIQSYSTEDLGRTFSWTYSLQGQTFVGFSFPDNVFVYNLTTNKWHERSSVINEITRRWRINSVNRAYEKLIVGDSLDGRIGYLDPHVYTEYGANIIREFNTQPFSNSGDEIVTTILELTMESGVGNDAVEDPKVGLSISKDGKTWGYERVRSIGKKGEYYKRVIWRKNGRCDHMMVLRFRLSDPVKPVFIKLEYE